MSAEVQRCKFCGTQAETEVLPHFCEAYCPMQDNTVCPYPPVIQAPTLEEAIEQFNNQFGAEEEA